MTIYTLGYSGWKLDDIRATVDRLDAVLIDVRMVPRSRVPQWSCYSLSREFGHRYAWVRELGNENYKGTFEQIKIANFPAGEKRLRELLALSPAEGIGAGPALSPVAGRSIILFQTRDAFAWTTSSRRQRPAMSIMPVPPGPCLDLLSLARLPRMKHTKRTGSPLRRQPSCSRMICLA